MLNGCFEDKKEAHGRLAMINKEKKGRLLSKV